jgi:hypothetical protein
MALGYVASLRNSRLNAITTALGGSALLRIYSGARPATGGAETTILAELVCNATFAPSATGGVLTLNPITQDSSANNTGTATWFRILTSGASPQIDGSVGVSGSDLNLTTTSITATQPVSITSFVITEGNP